jgi:hypothetical protein
MFGVPAAYFQGYALYPTESGNTWPSAARQLAAAKGDVSMAAFLEDRRFQQLEKR